RPQSSCCPQLPDGAEPFRRYWEIRRGRRTEELPKGESQGQWQQATHRRCTSRAMIRIRTANATSYLFQERRQSTCPCAWYRREVANTKPAFNPQPRIPITTR